MALPSLFRLADLPRRQPTDFALAPEAAERGALAGQLGLSALRKLRFTGRLVPVGRADWRLEADLGATVVQPCAVTLDPVTTRIDEPVQRLYSADWREPEADESPVPEDAEVEALPAMLDLAEVMAEALALALPIYPRAEGAELGAVAAGPPGAAPLDDDAARPLAGLKALSDRLRGSEDDRTQ